MYLFALEQETLVHVALMDEVEERCSGYVERDAWKSSPYDGGSQRQILSMGMEDALKLLAMVPQDYLKAETRRYPGVYR